jgi:cytochrome c oxidase subunit IV
MSEQRPDADARPPAADVWGFVKWSAISLFVIVVLGVLVARLLHVLGIE